MLRHIVMIKVKPEFNNEKEKLYLKTMLLNLETKIKSLLNIEVGINISTKPSAFDIVLTADFKDENNLDNYRVHPEHIKVLDHLAVVMEKATVVDYLL